MTVVTIEPGLDADGLRQVFLEPGALYCGTEAVTVRTVLGSCVAVCLLDRHGRAGGMNHYVLPNSPDGPPSLRYGDVAIEQLILSMGRFGCGIGDLRAKVFGGAAVLPFGAAEDSVGTKNVSLALARLRSRSIPILARRTGGPNGLLIRLNTATGSVMVRPIISNAESTRDGMIASYNSRQGGAAGDVPRVADSGRALESVVPHR